MRACLALPHSPCYLSLSRTTLSYPVSYGPCVPAKTAAAKVGELVDAANAHAADAAGAAKEGATPATQQLGEAARGVSAGVNEGLGVKPREP